MFVLSLFVCMQVNMKLNILYMEPFSTEMNLPVRVNQTIKYKSCHSANVALLLQRGALQLPAECQSCVLCGWKG